MLHTEICPQAWQNSSIRAVVDGCAAREVSATLPSSAGTRDRARDPTSEVMAGTCAWASRRRISARASGLLAFIASHSRAARLSSAAALAGAGPADGVRVVEVRDVVEEVAAEGDEEVAAEGEVEAVVARGLAVAGVRDVLEEVAVEGDEEDEISGKVARALVVVGGDVAFA